MLSDILTLLKGFQAVYQYLNDLQTLLDDSKELLTSLRDFGIEISDSVAKKEDVDVLLLFPDQCSMLAERLALLEDTIAPLASEEAKLQHAKAWSGLLAHMQEAKQLIAAQAYKRSLLKTVINKVKRSLLGEDKETEATFKKLTEQLQMYTQALGLRLQMSMEISFQPDSMILAKAALRQAVVRNDALRQDDQVQAALRAIFAESEGLPV